MRPKLISRPELNADYIVVLEDNPTNPDLSWADKYSYDAVASELLRPLASPESFYANPKWPYLGEKDYQAVARYFKLLGKFSEHNIPLAFPDIVVPPKDVAEAEQRYRVKNRAPYTVGGTGLAAALLGLASWQSKKIFSRRKLLRKGLALGAAATGASSSVELARRLVSSKVIGLEGRSALIAYRCEDVLAPLLAARIRTRSGMAAKLRRKPIVVLHIDKGHEDVIKFLENKKLRMETIQSFAPEIQALLSSRIYGRFLREMYIFQFGRYKWRRKKVSDSLFIKGFKPKGESSQAGFSRRDLLAAAFGAHRERPAQAQQHRNKPRRI
ncbi:MAG: hypothetical protein PHD95_05365 [Candidatus ainarchaeum sp.]|nr:hypothetical protein [Candidatus ainarchaeum sp.]